MRSMRSGSGQGRCCLRVVVAELDGLHVGVDQRRLLREALGQQLADDLDVDLEQRGEQRPAYTMFFIRMRLRTPSKFSLQIFASGTPRIVMSSRASTAARGHVES